MRKFHRRWRRLVDCESRIVASIARLSAVTTLAVLASCSAPASYRYELTLEVETPEGPRTGSGIIEVTVQRQVRLLPDMAGSQSRVHGEAIAIDLPGGQTLFATLAAQNGNDNAEVIAISSLLPPRAAGESIEERVALLSVEGRAADVPRPFYPLLVRFGDIRDPNSVERVDPDNLAASFGAGIQLRRIRVRTTRSEPGFSIQERLPWIGSQFRAYVTFPGGSGVSLTSSTFQRR